MSFLAPFALWFALSIPVVVLLYLLKRRRVPVRVSSTVLWQQYLAESQASAPFQKLRKNWLLFLQLLVLALAVLALLRPYLPGEETPSSLRVLILDASASMQSTDIAPSRFEAARSAARRWVDGLKPGQSMVILQAGPRIEVRQSETSDKPSLRRALDSCRVTDGSTRIVEALKMAESLIRDVPDAEIHLFSDGAVESLDAFESRNLPLVFHRVGERRHNVAFASLEVRANPENPGQRAVFCSLANLTPAPLETTVELAFEGEVLDVRPATLAPGETLPLVFLVNQQRDGLFSVRHTTDDDLSADNQASVVSLLPRPVRVLLVTRGNRFLEKALHAAGDVVLTVAADVPSPTAEWDFVVLDTVEPASWPDANLLAFQVAGDPWFERTGTVRAPAIVDWRSTHPLLRAVSLDDVAVAVAEGVGPPTWGTVLVESPQGPLVVAGERGRQRIAWIAFDLLESTWPLRVSFPIFIANAVHWLNPASARAERRNIHAGDPLRFELPTGVSALEVRPPGGSWEPMIVEPQSREAVFAGTDRQGPYTLRWDTNTAVVAVRALDIDESDSTPRDMLEMGRFSAAAATTLRAANVEIWRWFAVAALAVLLFEWWFFHRRTA